MQLARQVARQFTVRPRPPPVVRTGEMRADFRAGRAAISSRHFIVAPDDLAFASHFVADSFGQFMQLENSAAIDYDTTLNEDPGAGQNYASLDL